MIPRDAMRPGTARILFALLRIEASGETPTVRSVAAAAGISSTNSAWFQLRHLRDEGLVDWSDGKRSTLHSTVAVFPVGVR